MRLSTIRNTVITVVPILAVVLACMWLLTINYANPHKEQITVNEKTIGISKEKASYLIYTDGGVYEVQDLLFAGFFTSSDLFSELKEGKTYIVEVRGRRIPFLSYYKNITDAHEVDIKTEK